MNQTAVQLVVCVHQLGGYLRRGDREEGVAAVLSRSGVLFEDQLRDLAEGPESVDQILASGKWVQTVDEDPGDATLGLAGAFFGFFGLF